MIRDTEGRIGNAPSAIARPQAGAVPANLEAIRQRVLAKLAALTGPKPLLTCEGLK
jgi:hypothetical protein